MVRLSLSRILLLPLSWLWAAVARFRVFLYAQDWKKGEHPPGPTLSIGNLSAGGTGKTPLLFYALGELKKRMVKAGVLSRGYGGDEGLMLRNRHPEVALAEGANRVLGFQRLAKQEEAPEVWVLDDGFQHFKVQRDFDVVLIDARRPFGVCLPAGYFRETPRGLRRADLVVLSRASQVGELELTRIWQHIDVARGHAPALPRVEGDVFLSSIHHMNSGERVSDGWLKGKRVRLAAGIGNPQSFGTLILSEGALVEDVNWRRDHTRWSDSEVNLLQDDIPVLVTEKDAVKLVGRVPDNVYEVRVDWRFTQGEEDFARVLDDLVMPVRAAKIEPLWTAVDPHGRNTSGSTQS